MSSEYWTRTFAPESGPFAETWSIGEGEKKRRETTAYNEDQPLRDAQAAEQAKGADLARIASEVAGKSTKRSIGKARGTNTIFTGALGMGQSAALARKTLLGE